MGTPWTLADLEYWDAAIRERVADFGLDCYPQEFEVCDPNQMLDIVAYSGMPSHYPHWSYGKAVERQKTLYDHGLAGLPYEMVINSAPCLAYLMRDNSLCLQITTIAHVYGHNDFFKRNHFFSHTHAERTIGRFKSHAERVRGYIESPSIGPDRVEAILDAAHALSLNCRRNPDIRRLTPEEHRDRANAPPPKDPFQAIHKRPDDPPPPPPLEPDEDILLFVRDHNPRLADWERDLLTIVHEEAQYFLPQIETKIINEGWASYWHRAILDSLELPHDVRMEFIVRHNQVVRPIPGDVNPYHVGLKIWDDIERRAAGMTDADFAHLGETPKTPRQKMFAVREVERDASFLRRYLTLDLLREMDLFRYEQNENGDYVVTETPDEEYWRAIKDTLIANTGMGRVPLIRAIDADYDGNRELRLRHDFDGRELHMEYAEPTLRHLQTLWGRKVHLETVLDKTPVRLTHDGGGLQATQFTP